MAKVKVSQATIDKIKAMGMTKALKSAPKANPEMKEALTRMYGARRVAAAMPSKPVAKSADAARANASKSSGAKYKSADAARSSMNKTSSKSAAKPAVKKSGTTDPFAKAVFGVGGALKRTLTVKPQITAAQAEAMRKAKEKKSK